MQTYSDITTEIIINLNYIAMKNAEIKVKTERNFDQLISKLSDNEILTIQAMSHVKGGTADGTGSEPIVYIKL